MAKKVIVGGRIESKEVGGIVTGAAEILDDTKGKKQNVINQETDAELERLDGAKQDVLTFDNTPTEGSNNPVKSGGVYAADKALSDAIEAILLLIPSAASALNKLVDQATMNSSISTATATFRGTFNVVSDLRLTVDATHEQIELKLPQVISTADNNDYAYVQIPVSDQSTDIRRTERYKFNGTVWAYEYDLSTSGFTAAQWAAINSGITIALVGKLNDLPTNAALTALLGQKQDTLTFDNVPTLNSNNPVKSGGIYNVIKPITDLIPAEATAQNQLADKADVAAKILAAIPSWKGQYDALTDLQAVTGAKAGDMGCVKTTDSDGHAVLTFYQYSAQGTWVEYYVLRHYAQSKPATTGTTGDYPYNGMGRIELQKNIVNGVNTLTQAMLTQQNTIYVIQYDFTLGENITVPANCVLEFDGGSVNGSNTLTFDGTGISGEAKVLCGIAGTLIKADITWFGAKSGDNSIDTGAILNRIAAVTDHIVIPMGNFYIINNTVILAGKTIDWYGDIHYIGTQTNVEVFTVTGITKLNMHGGLVCDSASVSYTGEFGSNIKGLIAKNVFNSRLFVGTIYKFNVGLMVVGDGAGCSYNTFFLRAIQNCNIGVLVTQKTTNGNVGFANENTFIGGRIDQDSSWNYSTCEAHAVVVKGIYDTDNYNSCNNLCFFRQSVEGPTSYIPFVLKNTLFSSFEGYRAEGETNAFKLIGSCHTLRIKSGYGTENIDFTDFVISGYSVLDKAFVPSNRYLLDIDNPIYGTKSGSTYTPLLYWKPLNVYGGGEYDPLFDSANNVLGRIGIKVRFTQQVENRILIMMFNDSDSERYFYVNPVTRFDGGTINKKNAVKSIQGGGYSESYTYWASNNCNSFREVIFDSTTKEALITFQNVSKAIIVFEGYGYVCEPY